MERQREQSRKWYWKNREYYLAKSAATRKRLREEAKFMPKVFHKSIEAIEQELPYLLRQNVKRLRKSFLKIPILQRPPYDVYLKQLTIEYYKETSQ